MMCTSPTIILDVEFLSNVVGLDKDWQMVIRRPVQRESQWKKPTAPFSFNTCNTHDRNVKQLNGTHKAHVHSKNEANILAKYKPTIDVTSLIAELKPADKWGIDSLDYFKSSLHVLVYYEDLVNNLTLLKQKFFSCHVKIHKKPLSDQITNWGSVYTALKGTHVHFQQSVGQVLSLWF
ncbi:hypothetical protein ZIOFF_056556 [Zingiber officinale]|uniref:Uncharacterized protein n=1 Tax=Zingiber officinale TaxID=94328 RepID=A0A8J5KPE9_ZINOF|nr:hypothetical protein ZIOFF_056556 [Zingiber officinale]